jgi:hypothetical protein
MAGAVGIPRRARPSPSPSGAVGSRGRVGGVVPSLGKWSASLVVYAFVGVVALALAGKGWIDGWAGSIAGVVLSGTFICGVTNKARVGGWAPRALRWLGLPWLWRAALLAYAFIVGGAGRLVPSCVLGGTTTCGREEGREG